MINSFLQVQKIMNLKIKKETTDAKVSVAIHYPFFPGCCNKLPVQGRIERKTKGVYGFKSHL
jgi:hypothetical protein